MKTCISKYLNGLIISALVITFLIIGVTERLHSNSLEKIRRIEELNKQLEINGNSWRAEENKFSEITEEQLSKFLRPLPEIPRHILKTVPVIMAPVAASYASSWDWRDVDETNYVTSIKDQYEFSDCGSCWAFAAVAQLESHVMIYDNERTEDLSEQQALSCNDYNYGCEGGAPHGAYYLFEYPGAVADTCMEYTGYDTVTCRQDECAIHARIEGFSLVYNNESSLKQALMDGPVWIAATCLFPFLSYSEGCYDMPTFGYPVNHAMLCIGWDDSVCVDTLGVYSGAWIVKNSFGDDWGMDGYCYIKYGECNFGDQAFQISYLQGEPEELQVQAPEGGEVWSIGSQHTIKWHSIDSYDYFEIGYIQGSTYTQIDDDVDGDEREFIWTLSGSESEECRIAIFAYDSGDTVIVSDTTTADFTMIDSRCEWSYAGVALSGETGTQYAQTLSDVIPDGYGGSFIVWSDYQRGCVDIYAQRVDSTGAELWTSGGVLVTPNTVTARQLLLPSKSCVADGSGGLIVTWKEGAISSEKIIAQHLGSTGTLQWTSAGKTINAALPLCNTTTWNVSSPSVVSDGSGGAIFVWQYEGSSPNLYAQRITSAGSRNWDPCSVQLSASAGAQTKFDAISDGNYGAIVAWMDSRNGTNDIYAQKINSSGSRQWGNQGTAVCTATGIQGAVAITGTLGNSVIFCWEDYRDTDYDIYAQKFNSSGTVQWTSNGILICSANDDQKSPSITDDTFGGAIIAWEDQREECNPVGAIPTHCMEYSVYAQRVSSNGDTEWTTDGVGICLKSRNQFKTNITFDGSGGALISWIDDREGIGPDNYYDIFMQRIDVFGDIEWLEDGEPIVEGVLDPTYHRVIGDHSEEVYLAWTDERNGEKDVFIQKVAGDFDNGPRCTVSAEIVKNGTNYSVEDTFMVGCPEGDGPDTLLVYCDFYDSDMSGSDTIDPEDITLDTSGLPFSFCGSDLRGTTGDSGNGYIVALVRPNLLECSGCEGSGCGEDETDLIEMTVYYDGKPIGFVTDMSMKSFDYTGDGNVNLSDFSSLGETYDKSLGDEGYNGCFDFTGNDTVNSIDLSLFISHYHDLCPVSSSRRNPMIATGSGISVLFDQVEVSGEVLRVSVGLRNASDVSLFAMGLPGSLPGYRFSKWVSSFGPVTNSSVTTADWRETPILFVSAFIEESNSAEDFDIGTMEFRRVGSQSDPSAVIDALEPVFGEALHEDGSIRAIAGVDVEPGTPACINRLGNAFPNPFNPSTLIHYSIASAADVSINIYDVTGRLIKILVNEHQHPKLEGYTVEWNGRNNNGSSVASGVYFYKMKAGDFSNVKKMVLLR